MDLLLGVPDAANFGRVALTFMVWGLSGLPDIDTVALFCSTIKDSGVSFRAIKFNLLLTS